MKYKTFRSVTFVEGLKSLDYANQHGLRYFLSIFKHDSLLFSSIKTGKGDGIRTRVLGFRDRFPKPLEDTPV